MESDRVEMMLRYVERYYRESRFYMAQNSAKGQEFNRIHAILEDLPNQFYPQTATWGLQFWEELLDLHTGNKNLEQRRNQVILKMRSSQMITPITLKHLLEDFSKTKVHIANTSTPYTFEVEVMAREDIFQTNLKDLRKIIEDIKPAHLSLLTTMVCLLDVPYKINYLPEVELFTEYSVFPRIVKNYMNGKIKMNGNYQMDSYNDRSQTEIYQSKMDWYTEASPQKIEVAAEATYQDIYTIPAALTSVTDLDTTIQQKTPVRAEQDLTSTCTVKYNIKDCFVIEKHRNQMNGKRKMNGAIKMNSEVVTTTLDQP